MVGTCHRTTLAWGFVIPQDKLLALFHAFRKHSNGDSSGKEPSAQELDDKIDYDDALQELSEDIQDVMMTHEARRILRFEASGLEPGAEELDSPVVFAFYYEVGPIQYSIERWDRGEDECEWVKTECRSCLISVIKMVRHAWRLGPC
jgi:hypothetical protein